MAILVNDLGIYLQIIGFVLLLLTGGRHKAGGGIMNEKYEPTRFDKFREKIISERWVEHYFVIGIGLVIIGLTLHLSFNRLFV